MTFFFIFSVSLCVCNALIYLQSSPSPVLSVHLAACFCVDSNNTQQIEYFIFIQHSNILCAIVQSFLLYFNWLVREREKQREKANGRTSEWEEESARSGGGRGSVVMMEACKYIATVPCYTIRVARLCAAAATALCAFPPLSYYFRTMVSAIRIRKVSVCNGVDYLQLLSSWKMCAKLFIPVKLCMSVGSFGRLVGRCDNEH